MGTHNMDNTQECKYLLKNQVIEKYIMYNFILRKQYILRTEHMQKNYKESKKTKVQESDVL